MKVVVKLTRGGKLAALIVSPVFIAALYLGATGWLVDSWGEIKCEIAFRPRQTQEFSLESWRAAELKKGTKYPMANWLIKERYLIGKNSKRVLELLGQPSSKRLDAGNICWDYVLARQSDYPARSIFAPFGLSNMDYWYLRIRFQSNHVTGCQIIVKG